METPQVNLHAAKTHLSRLVERASHGEVIVIARHGRPVARLCPLEEPVTKRRRPGRLAGQIKAAPDFDAPLPKELLRMIYEGRIEPRR